MKANLSIPGYRVFEYSLVLNPHEALCEKIMEIKKEFFEHYKGTTFFYGKPHLTLARFTQYQLAEERIINHLKTIAMGSRPVKIELKDYGSFPSHSIYINVTTKIPLQNLVKQIRTETQRLMKLDDEHKPHFFLEPHIPVAGKLQPWQYEKGWLEYSHRQFTGRFIADAMLLLKRPAGELKYQIAGRFEFQNLPVATTQGELFGSV